MCFCTSLYLDPKGDLWIGTYDNGFNRMDLESEIFTRYLPDRPTFTITGDHQGNIWAGSVESLGLYRLNLPSNSIRHFQSIPGDTTSLVNGTIWSLLVDSAGELWVGSVQNLPRSRIGLNRFIQDTERFIRYEIPDKDDKEE